MLEKNLETAIKPSSWGWFFRRFDATLTLMAALLYTNLAAAEQVVYVDAVEPFIIVDHLPSVYGFTTGEKLCILNIDGFVETCNATVLFEGQRLVIQVAKSEVAGLKLNSSIRIKSAFLQEQDVNLKVDDVQVFRTAKIKLSAKQQKLAELGQKQESEIAKLIPRNTGIKPKATGGAAGIGAGGVPLKKVYDEPRRGVVNGGASGLEYDKEFNEYLKKIEENMTRVPDIGAIQMGVDVNEPGGIAAVDDEANKSKSNAGRSPFSYSQVQAFRIFSINSLYKYQVLKFKSLEDNERKRDTLWTKSGDGANSIGGVGFQLSLLTRSNAVYFFGGRYRSYDSQSFQTRLFTASASQVISTRTDFSSYGFWLDIGKRFKFIEGLEGLFSYGLDWDNSELKFVSLRKSTTDADQGGIIGFGTSKTQVFGLRLSADQRFYYSKFGFNVGICLTVPIWQTVDGFAGEVATPEGVELTSEAEDDLVENLGHKRQMYSFDTFAGLVYRF